MLVDCFLFNNELDLAKFRVSYLAEFTGAVIIAESDETHSGHRKPLILADSLNNSRRDGEELFVKPIIRFQYKMSKNMTPGERDIQSRELLIQYAVKRFPDSKILLSDLDEIPSVEQVENFLELEGCYRFNMNMSFRYANWRLSGPNSIWNRGVMGNSQLSQFPDGGRFEPFPELPTKSRGSHLSWLKYGDSSIKSKLLSTSHSELAQLDRNLTSIVAYADFYQIHHLGRYGNSTLGLLEVVPESMLSSVEQAALVWNPKWFDFRKPRKGVFSRFLAAVILTEISKQNKRSELLLQHFVLKNRSFSLSNMVLSILVMTRGIKVLREMGWITNPFKYFVRFRHHQKP